MDLITDEERELREKAQREQEHLDQGARDTNQGGGSGPTEKAYLAARAAAGLYLGAAPDGSLGTPDTDSPSVLSALTGAAEAAEQSFLPEKGSETEQEALFERFPELRDVRPPTGVEARFPELAEDEPKPKPETQDEGEGLGQ